MECKHFYLRKNGLLTRLRETYKKFGKLIIAYDFDDTVHPTSWCDSCEEVVELLKGWRDHAIFVVFTSNWKKDYIVEYLTKNQIPFDEINRNCEVALDWYKSYGLTKFDEKVYYNVFLDDKAGLAEVYEALSTLLAEIESDE